MFEVLFNRYLFLISVARIYATLLKNLKVLPANAVVKETSGSDLANGGVSKLKEIIGSMAAGGVLFLDEAYQLNPKLNPGGAAVCLSSCVSIYLDCFQMDINKQEMILVMNITRNSRPSSVLIFYYMCYLISRH